MAEMSRRLGFLLGLVLAAVLGEMAARAVLADRAPEIRWYDAATQLKVEQMEGLVDVDVAYAGTSMAWQAFVPDVVERDAGLDGYNVGLAGGTPEVMERWLVEEAVPRLEPQTVVWGLSSFDLAPAYGAEQRRLYDRALATRTGPLARLEQVAAERSTLVANRTVLRSLSATFGTEADRRRGRFEGAADVLGTDGERLDFAVDVGQRRREIVAARLAGFAPSADDVATIERTISALRSRDVEVVLVELPVPERFVAAHPGGAADHRQVGEVLADLAARLDVRFLRAPDGFGDADFVDYTHLDRPAATEFSRRVAARLAAGDNDARRAPAESADDPAASDTTSTASRDCEVVIVEDEYGFEVEVERCGGAEPQPDARPDDPAPEDATGAESPEPPTEPGPDTQPIVDRVLLQSGCTDDGVPAPWDAILDGVDDALAVRLDSALLAVEAAEAVCGRAEYVARFEDAVVELERAAGIDRAVVDESSLAEISSRAIAAVERLSHTIERRSVTRASSIWYHADEAASRLWLEQAEASGSAVRTVAIGDSTTNYAVSQPMLDEGLGGGFLNLAIAGADPEEWVTLYPRLFEGITPPEHVIWPLTTHRLLDRPGRRCESLAGPHLRTTVRTRRQLLPLFRDSLPVREMIFGDDLDGSAFDGSPVADAIVERYHAPGDRVVPVGTYVGMPAGQAWYPGATFCPQRIGFVRELVEELRSDGIEVTVALLPIHPEVQAASDLHPVARASLIDAAVAAGARVIEIDEPYLDEETFDGWHPNEIGQRRVSADLLRALER